MLAASDRYLPGSGTSCLLDARTHRCNMIVRLYIIHFDTLRSRPNGHHFADDIFNAFSSMEMYEFWLKFHYMVLFTISHHLLIQWLSAYQATSHYLNQWWSDYWSIYASLGLKELNWLKKFRCILQIYILNRLWSSKIRKSRDYVYGIWDYKDWQKSSILFRICGT